MNIAQALKEKNRLSGQIKQLEVKIQNNNKFTGETPVFNTVDLLGELRTKRQSLVDLKASIARANVGIATELVNLAEAKAHLTFLNTFSAYCGPAKSTTTTGYGEREKEVIVTSQVTIQEIATALEEAQALINTLQDKVDAFNAVTTV